VKIFRRFALALSAALTVLAIAALLWVVVFLNRAVAPVRLAVKAAQASGEFRNAVGEPVQTGTFVRGKMNLTGQSGNADLVIPISGDRGEGVLQEWAQQQSGKWHLCSLSYWSKDGQTRITILPDESAPCERE
jgi:Cytochrome oxidase complex assembly protein 1